MKWIPSSRMASLAVLACLSLGAPSRAHAEPPAAPSAEDEAAARALSAALEAGDDAATVEAIHAAADVDVKDVVELLARAAADPSHAVQSAALEALGGNRHPDALKALHRRFKVDKALREDETLFVTLLRAIGRHAHASSIDILLEDPFDHLTLEVGRARIMCLAGIRSKDSVKALVHAMTLASPGTSRRSVGEANEPFMRWGAAAMSILTGADAGRTKTEWLEWWRKHGDELVVSTTPPRVPASARKEWEDFWGEPYASPPTSPDTGPAPVARVYVESPPQADVDAAIDLVESDVKDGDEIAATVSIQRLGLLLSPDAVRTLASLHRARSTAVAVAAIQALGYMPMKEAAKALNRLYQSSPKLRDDEYMLPVLLKAIGRHGDPSSLAVLTDKPLKNLTRASGTARILGVARIRDEASIEALTKAMQLGGADARRRASVVGAPRFGNEFRLALAILTGQDLGTSKQAWLDWWRDAKKTFQVAATPPRIAPELWAAWEEYWGETYPAK